MAKGKKFDYRTVENDSSWTAEIVRRVTSKKTMVSKSQDGFASEAEAKAWGEAELKQFSENLNKQNKRRAEQRQVRNEKSES